MTKGKHSAGILMFRWKEGLPKLFLVHPGGPFWSKKDDGSWSIPKGLFDEAENALDAAKREFEEETGCRPVGEFFELGEFKQPSGKIISAWGAEGTFNLSSFRSNTFSMEWPPKSGRMAEFPEADRADWFDPDEALKKVTKGQIPILQTLLTKLGTSINSKPETPQARFDSKGQGSLF